MNEVTWRLMIHTTAFCLRRFPVLIHRWPFPRARQGFLWLATRDDAAGVWNQAGGSFATEFGGSWDDDEDEDDHDHSADAQSREEDGGQAQTVPANGASDGVDDLSNSRRNELVFIGLGMDEDALKAELRRCLLSEEEMAGGPADWNQRFSDPFPPWE